jgi:hypothetical protein
VLAIAALVPETVLLVPGAAGRAVVLEDVRAAALDAVGALVAAAPDRLVVVASGPVDRVVEAPVRPSLAAAGIADGVLGWAVPPEAGGPRGAVPAVGASVALLALAHAGWVGPLTVLEVAPCDELATGADAAPAERARAAALRARGAELAAQPGRLALLVAGSLSARRGTGAPLAPDERAGPLDDAVLEDLATADPPALDRLGRISGSLAAELAVTAWAPLQVLLGAAEAAGPLDASVEHASAPFGVTYAVTVWRASR